MASDQRGLVVVPLPSSHARWRKRRFRSTSSYLMFLERALPSGEVRQEPWRPPGAQHRLPALRLLARRHARSKRRRIRLPRQSTMHLVGHGFPGAHIHSARFCISPIASPLAVLKCDDESNQRQYERRPPFSLSLVRPVRASPQFRGPSLTPPNGASWSRVIVSSDSLAPAP